ncbi:MAG: single-stranded DNA-binding protein, partial [Elusimicrobiota bacterium]
DNGKGDVAVKPGVPGSNGSGVIEAENRACIKGRFVREAQMRQVSDGGMRAFFTLAVPRSFNARRGEKNAETTYVPVVAWTPIAEACGMLGKGSIVRVEGRLGTWRGDDGRERWKVTADLLETITPKPRVDEASA